MSRGRGRTSSRIHNGEGRIIGDRGGARNEELGEVYQHLGGGRIQADGSLKGGSIKGRWRSVFNAVTRESLEQDYPDGSIIVKRRNPLAVAMRDLTGWPGSESGRVSGRQLVRRNQIKAGAAGLITLWSGVSYEASPIGTSFIPSPTETISAAWTTPDRIDNARFGDDDSQSSSPTTVPNPDVSTPPTGSGEAPNVTVEVGPAATSLPPFGEGVVTTPPSSNLLPLPTAPNTLAPTVTTVEQGNSSAAFTFGEMTCANTVQVTISEGEFPFTALARVTGEPLDDLVEGDAFWNTIVSSLNGGSVNTDAGDSFIGPDNCTTYQTINNGFIN